MQDPEFEVGADRMRRTLQKENRLYKTALDHEMEEMKEQAKQIGKVALIAGGAILGGYLLIKLLRKSGSDTERISDDKNMVSGKTQVVVDRPVKENSFSTLIKEQLALLLVAVVREKLADITGVEKKKLEEKKDDLTGKS